MARTGLSKRLRFEVFRRDGHACRYCGASAPDVTLTVDHVVPVALGGSDTPDNLVAACQDCNAGKTSLNPDAPVVAAVRADALRWAQAMALATELRRAELKDQDEDIEVLDERWKLWGFGEPRQEVPRPGNWQDSTRRFLIAGLDIPELDRYVDIAMRRQVGPDSTWTYFCGCCWNEIKERQELARELLLRDDVDA